MFLIKPQFRFHGVLETLLGHIYKPIVATPAQTVTKHFTIRERELTYRFYSHFHPYVGELVQRLLDGSVAGLQAADTDYRTDTTAPKLSAEIFSGSRYDPNTTPTDATDVDVVQQMPVKDLDFSVGGPYAVYNWELFFHVPLTIGLHLSKNQRFAEAQQWFHYLFDPTDNTDGPTPERFWKVQPFRKTPVRQAEELLVNLSTNADSALWLETMKSIEAWKDSPFRPHVIARFRPSAYMFKTVMAYLDNLIAWGDSLFQQDTRETLNEATQLYVLAANILGPRPQRVPKKGTIKAQTYDTLKKAKSGLNAFGNALVDIESELPFDFAPPAATTTKPPDGSKSLRSLGQTLYFCIPQNPKLLDYWDTVADRLFKIRNSLNIRGIFRQLPLFEPPIDPSLLAKATAAGLDVGAAVSAASQPLLPVRFQLLLQKATELSQEVKSLGNNLLSAMEKEDNEALTVLRARHEKTVLGLAEAVKYGHWQEAIKGREGLEQTLLNAVQRYVYYERLLGKQQAEITVPERAKLEVEGLDKLKFSTGEPQVAPREIAIDIAQAADAGGHLVSSHEQQELSKLKSAQTAQDAAVGLDAIAGIVRLIPELGINIQPFGVGGDVKIGGAAIAGALQIAAGIARGVGARDSYEASRAAKIGGHARREQDWSFQSSTIAGEITQLFKQVRGAEIREYLAERELKNHQKQMEHSAEVERFLTDEAKGKKTNQGFYAYLKREARGLHAACFQLAFEVAKKAERALQHERGDSTLSFLSTGYLAGREGLFAGEKLFLDLKRMELAWHELNEREYELTKHVSVLQLNPEQLLVLRRTGTCTVQLPEALFDLDGPGHYFRRIKSVAVSIPCVTGPFANVNCRLTLQGSSIRRKTPVAGGYARAGQNDDRFEDLSGSAESVVTSSAQNDSGLFETNLRDDRYLPFEGAGAISTFVLTLPSNPSKGEPQQFDYDSIADVVFHVRYTAREGGETLRQGALANLTTLIDQATPGSVGSVRLVSARHEFPSEWARFKSAKNVSDAAPAKLALQLEERHYPFWSRDRLKVVKRVEVVASTGRPTQAALVEEPAGGPAAPVPAAAALTRLTADANLGAGMLRAALTPLPSKPACSLSFYASDNGMEDLWLLVTWAKQ
ncbi:MAG: hypothetical protein Q8L48_06020 [Archangium sp.]|nr:hypothetical protein [Archangium sp.]